MSLLNSNIPMVRAIRSRQPVQVDDLRKEPTYIAGDPCAMIWIAGARRIAGKNACIGFHGMYDPASGQPIADGNAIAGAHLGLSGLSLDAVFWMLTPRQLDVHWLTDETAEKYGIYWTHDKDDPGHSCPNQRSEASGNQEQVRWHTSSSESGKYRDFLHTTGARRPRSSYSDIGVCSSQHEQE